MMVNVYHKTAPGGSQHATVTSIGLFLFFISTTILTSHSLHNQDCSRSHPFLHTAAMSIVQRDNHDHSLPAWCHLYMTLLYIQVSKVAKPLLKNLRKTDKGKLMSDENTKGFANDFKMILD